MMKINAIAQKKEQQMEKWLKHAIVLNKFYFF